MLTLNAPQSPVSQAAKIFQAFSLLVRGGASVADVIGFAEGFAVQDPLLGIAVYSVWLETEQSPAAGAIWYNLGILYRNCDDWENAESAFRMAVERLPSLKIARYALVMVLENRGEFAEALRHSQELLGPIGSILEVAKTQGPERELYVLALEVHGRLLEKLGRFSEAEYTDEQCLFLGGPREEVSARVVALAARRRALYREPPRSDIGVRRLMCVHFDIVDGCQLQCVGCPNTALHRPVKMIEPEFFRRCLENIDVDVISMLRLFNFGEPLLHKRLVDVMKVVDEFRVGPVRVDMVEVSANAQNVDMVQFEEVLRNGTIDRLIVSCDGDGTKESFERLRRPSKWEKLVKFLEDVANIRAKYNLKITLQTRTIIEGDEPEQRWNSLLLPLGWDPEFRPWYHFPGALENRTGRPLKPGKGRCNQVTEHNMFINADGTVVPCCAHPRAGNFGNLSEFKYSQLFDGPQRNEFLTRLDTERETVPVCNECET